jgi:interferon-induced GTP-binding protein Mx1
VLTKPDTIGEGNEEEVLQVVQGLRKPLKLGYLMVKNRSQKQIDEGLTLMEARELEKSFFSTHAQFSAADPSFFGVENLMSRLTGVLVARIQDGLPTMRKEISELKEKTIAELNEMGKPPPTDASNMRAVTLQLAQEVTSMVNEATKGEYSSAIFSRASLRMMARIREEGGPHDTFRKAVIALKPTGEWEVPVLRKSIASMRGRELPGFLNFKVFDMLLKQAVAMWKEPALTMLQSVKSIVEEVCEEIVELIIPQYRTMASGMKQITQTIIDERTEHVRSTVIEQWVGVESAAFTLQVEFFELYNKKKVERFAQAYDKMAPDLMAQLQGNTSTGQEQARKRMIQWYEQTHSVGDATNEHHEAEDMQMLLESYWKTACDRAVDSICMKIDQHLIQKLSGKALEVLITLSLDEGKIAAFFAQDPRVREKRVKLQARLDRLKKAQALICNSV